MRRRERIGNVPATQMIKMMHTKVPSGNREKGNANRTFIDTYNNSDFIFPFYFQKIVMGKNNLGYGQQWVPCFAYGGLVRIC
ncbi:hypothetical protein PRIPAC_92804 [Pristionchus pacificus]|uniref:Uncharacterized protein n=1 Tax=Pristionchus pacificus TaxID=54126 RepID=A0A2A6CH98_PRIPA|nr:hypothetical protein PRIPAC_92804 [Pristionchus pacificus]|eukprot:PDM77509.1 hypothetical protein PRIPAC_34376 [Pristionchus pacificus]